jgi:hypothetical protein
MEGTVTTVARIKWNLGVHNGVDKVLMPTASGVVVFGSPILNTAYTG